MQDKNASKTNGDDHQNPLALLRGKLFVLKQGLLLYNKGFNGKFLAKRVDSKPKLPKITKSCMRSINVRNFGS